MANIIPENYRAVKDSMGLIGLYKRGKNGQEKLVMPHFFVKMEVARCYNRIMIAYMTSGDNFIILRNYNNTHNTSGMNICDIKFGAHCLYALIYSETENKSNWWLLDKDLRPVKNVGYFEFGDEWCDGDYFKIEKESIVVVVNGHQKKLVLKTGDIEDVYIYKKREQKVLAPVKSYDLYFDLVKNMITARADNSLSISHNVNGIADLKNYIGLFQVLLGDTIESEDNSIASIHYVGKELAEAFIKLIRQFEFMGDISVLLVLTKLYKKKCSDNLQLIKAIDMELHKDTCIYENGKDKYNGLVYIASNLLIVVIRNSNGRLTCNMQELKPEWMNEDIVKRIISSYKSTGINVCRLNIDENSVSSLEMNKDAIKLPIPASIKRRPDIIKDMNSRETSYEEFVKCECKGKIIDASNNIICADYGININLAINLQYIPKKKQGKTNICRHVKINVVYPFVS